MSAFVKRRRKNSLILKIKPGMRFTRSVIQNPLRVRIGIEWFPLLDADGLKLINHDFVAFKPWLSLHEAIERLKETQIVGNGAVEHDVDKHQRTLSVADGRLVRADRA